MPAEHTEASWLTRHGHRMLGAALALPGALVTAYAAAALLLAPDPLAGLVVALVLAPALPPIAFGIGLWRGKAWGLWGGRLWLLGILAAGAALHWGMRLEVFSFPPVAVPLIGGIAAWLIASWLCPAPPGS